jgi:hypothetical protein
MVAQFQRLRFLRVQELPVTFRDLGNFAISWAVFPICGHLRKSAAKHAFQFRAILARFQFKATPSALIASH